MEKLELKHLAPYLPYGLKIKTPHGWDTMSTLNADEINGDFEDSYEYSEIKPILQPLSDLAKLSEDVEINEHSINLHIEEKYKVSYGLFSQYKSKLSIELDEDSSVGYDQDKKFSFDVILEIQSELLKGHYDIFCLIDKGLAIDINTFFKMTAIENQMNKDLNRRIANVSRHYGNPVFDEPLNEDFVPFDER